MYSLTGLLYYSMKCKPYYYILKFNEKTSDLIPVRALKSGKQTPSGSPGFIYGEWTPDPGKDYVEISHKLTCQEKDFYIDYLTSKIELAKSIKRNWKPTTKQILEFVDELEAMLNCYEDYVRKNRYYK